MSSRIFIEEIASEESLRATAEADDMAAVAEFGSPARRREVLAWRAIVRREVGRSCRIDYDAVGAPTLSTPDIHIGISHCRDRVAVILSAAPCAIDIESADRNFEGVATRFLNERERSHAAEGWALGKMWCIKEAVYKYLRNSSLHLQGDIEIRHLEGERFVAEVPHGKSIEGWCRTEGEHIIAVVE